MLRGAHLLLTAGEYQSKSYSQKYE